MKVVTPVCLLCNYIYVLVQDWTSKMWLLIRLNLLALPITNLQMKTNAWSPNFLLSEINN